MIKFVHITLIGMQEDEGLVVRQENLLYPLKDFVDELRLKDKWLSYIVKRRTQGKILNNTYWFNTNNVVIFATEEDLTNV